jgi:hypothetical protein
MKMNKFPDAVGFLSSATEWSRCPLDMDSSCEYGKYSHHRNGGPRALGPNVRLHTTFLKTTPFYGA